MKRYLNIIEVHSTKRPPSKGDRHLLPLPPPACFAGPAKVAHFSHFIASMDKL